MVVQPTLLTQRTEDIEITPEVLAAGINEYGLFDAADPSEWVVPAIYRAMLRAAIQSGQVKFVSADSGDAGVA